MKSDTPTTDQVREYLPRSAVDRIVPLYREAPEGRKILLSQAARRLVHIASQFGLPICRNQGRTNLVFEKLFLGTVDDITCGHCKRYAASEHFDRFHTVLLEGANNGRSQTDP